jgi:hypothetical protein
MKLISSILFLVLLCHFGYGQKMNAVWCFGDSAGIDFNDVTNPSTFSSGMNAKGSCSSISDSTGQLLFYCATPDINGFWNGVVPLGIVYNKYHQEMINGDSLSCELWYHEMEIVPFPSNLMHYYIFHIGVTGQYGLYYSIVDMSQDGGNGAVITKNNQLNNYLAQDCLQSVKHGNGRDWWILFHSPIYPDSFFVYLIDSTGVTLHHIDTLGIQSTSNGGDLRFNSSGTQFAYCSLKGALAIYDFDRCSGQILLSKIVHTEDSTGSYPNFFDVCFSPNDSLLYLSCAPYYSSLDTSEIYLYQMRLWMSNVYASKIMIWNIAYPNFPGAVRLAPDNKIYITSVSIGFPNDSTNYYFENTHLTVINNPNGIGNACNIQPYSFYLGGKRVYLGLPNNPNYDLPALGGSFCDTLGYPNTVEEITDEKWLAYPNPANSIIRFSNIKYSEFTELLLIDVTGRLVLSEENTFKIDVSGLPSGIYSALITSGESLVSLKVFVQH